MGNKLSCDFAKPAKTFEVWVRLLQSRERLLQANIKNNRKNTINIVKNIPAIDIGWNKKPNSPTKAMKRKNSDILFLQIYRFKLQA